MPATINGTISVAVGTSTAVSSVAIPVPTGAAVGEKLIAITVGPDDTIPTAIPTGWTLHHQRAGNDTSSNTAIGIWEKWADGTETGTVTFTGTGTANRMTGFMFRVGGVDATTPFDVATVSAAPGTAPAAATFTSPAIAPVTAGTLLVHLGAVNSGTTVTITGTPPEVTQVAATPTGGNGRTSYLYTETRASAGSTGTRSWTQTTTTTVTQWGYAVLAFRPSATTGATLTATPTDTAGGTDTATWVLTAQRTPTDTAAAADSATTGATLTATPTDTAGATDQVTATLTPGGSTQVAFRAASTGFAGDTPVNATISIPRPVGTLDGDLLIAVAVQDLDGVEGTMTTPAGWSADTRSTTRPAAANGWMHVWTKTAAAGDPTNFTFTNTSTGAPDIVMGIIAVSGQHTTTPLAVTPTFNYSTVAGTAQVAPSVTGVAGGLLVSAFGRSDSANAAATYTMPATMTERVDNGPTGHWTSLAIGTEDLAAAGATGTRTATCSDSAQWTTMSLIVAPAGAGTATPADSAAATDTTTPVLTAQRSAADTAATSDDVTSVLTPPAVSLGVKGAVSIAEVGSAGAISIAIPVPTGVLAGEKLIAWVIGPDDTIPTASPTGWTLYDTQNGFAPDANTAIGIWHKTADGTETDSVTFTGTGVASRITGFMARVGGADSTSPFDTAPVSGAGAGATTYTSPAITTVTANALLLHLTALNSATTSAITAVPTGLTQLATNPAVDTTTAGRRAYLYTETRATAGTTGTRTGWTNNAATQWGYAVIALRPAAGGVAVAPTVGAGADTTTTTGVPFTRTATESDGGAAITTRSWTIVSGPTGTGTTLATTAALSWTPAAAGTYVLRYTATNSVGSGTDDVTVTVTSAGPTGPTGVWTQVFNDDFDGTTLDTSKWNALDNWAMNGVTNMARNVSVSGGQLVLTLESSSFGAGVSTEPWADFGSYTVQVGDCVEARVYMPGDGSIIYNWPAFWTSGPNWPTAGENDIAEVLGQQLAVNYHYADANGVHQQGGPWVPAGYWGNAFHTYTMHRKAASVDVYWDGTLVRSYPTSDNGAGQAILLNVGVSDTSVTGTDSQIKVDWVRAWRPAAAAPTPTLVSRVVDIPTDTTAVVKVDTTNTTAARLKVGTNTAVTTGVVYGTWATPTAEGLAELTVTNLTPGTQYYYRVEMADSAGVPTLDTGTVGEFDTDTAPGVPQTFSFAFSACTNATDSQAMANIATRKPAMFLHLGDLYYADATGTSVANFRAKVDAKITVTNHAAVFSTVPTSYTPSDHDLMNNNVTGGSDATAATNFNQVYRERFPTTGLPASGVYRSFRRGRVRFIRLDTRTFASNPAAADDATKVRLGATQEQWFKDQLTAATEPLIIVQQADPWVGDPVPTDDAWTGYTTERARLGAFIAGTGKRVVFIAGDMHAVAAHNGVSGSVGGIPVLQAAPLNNNASQKGGPYTVGPYPATGTALTQQYGWVDIADSGSQITLAFTGYSSSGTTDTPRVQLTLTTPLTDAAAASDTVTTNQGVGSATAPTDRAAAVDQVSVATTSAGAALIPDPAAASDVVSVLLTSVRTATDPAAATDTTTALIVIPVAATDRAATTDTIRLGYGQRVTDTAAVSDFAFTPVTGHVPGAAVLTSDGISDATLEPVSEAAALLTEPLTGDAALHTT